MKRLFMFICTLMLTITPCFATEINYSGSFQDCVDHDKIEMNLDLVVPGDEESETIHFKNVLKEDIKVYLVLESQSNELYDLTISKDDQELLTANAGKMVEGEKLLLGTFENNESCDLTFTLKVPESLNNDYTLESDEAKWKLVVEEKTKSPKTGIYTNSVYLIGALGALIIAIIGGRRKHE